MCIKGVPQSIFTTPEFLTSEVWQKKRKIQTSSIYGIPKTNILLTVDGRNPASVEMENLPLFTVFYNMWGGCLGILPSTEFPWKLMLGIRPDFPFGSLPIFRCKLAVVREGVFVFSVSDQLSNCNSNQTPQVGLKNTCRSRPGRHFHPTPPKKKSTPEKSEKMASENGGSPFLEEKFGTRRIPSIFGVYFFFGDRKCKWFHWASGISRIFKNRWAGKFATFQGANSIATEKWSCSNPPLQTSV